MPQPRGTAPAMAGHPARFLPFWQHPFPLLMLIAQLRSTAAGRAPSPQPYAHPHMPTPCPHLTHIHQCTRFLLFFFNPSEHVSKKKKKPKEEKKINISSTFPKCQELQAGAEAQDTPRPTETKPVFAWGWKGDWEGGWGGGS